MVASTVLLMIINAVLFSFIFWFITFILKFYYSKKYYSNKYNFYECGFKNYDCSVVRYNINYVMLMLFLVIYDGEFLILIPFSLKVSIINFTVIYFILFFIIWLLITLLIDNLFHALDWQNFFCMYIIFYILKIKKKIKV